METVFLLGSARSGTTLIRNVLNSNESINILPETGYFDRLWQARLLLCGIGKLDRDKAIKLAYYTLFHSHDPNMQPYRVFIPDVVTSLENLDDYTYENIFTEILKVASLKLKANTKVFGEKTPRHSFMALSLFKRFPSSKFIITVRDPRAVVSSMIARGDMKLDTIEAACAEYVFSYSNILRLTELAPSNCLVIKYEDFVNEPEPILENCSSFLGVKNEYSLGNITNNSSFENGTKGISNKSLHSWKNNLNSSEVELIESYCKEVMDKFDYKCTTEVSNIGNKALFNLKLQRMIGNLGMRPITAWLDK